MTGPAYFSVRQSRTIVAQPQENSSGGIVTFTPTPSEAESTALDETLVLGVVEGYWVSGQLCSRGGTPGVALVDNRNLDLAAGELVYSVEYVPPLLAPFTFAAPGDGSQVDLSTVERLPA